VSAPIDLRPLTPRHDLDARQSVSIVIPCFNQARYLPGAFESVRRQTATVGEVIVVDDGSTDDTAAVAGRGGAAVLRQDNLGLSAARNAGLRAASGAFVLFLDADDELLPDAVASALVEFAGHSHAACVAGTCVLMDAAGRPLATDRPSPGPDLYRSWLGANFVWTPGAVLFRRSDLMALGGFPAGVGPAADYAVYLALAREGRVVFDRRDRVRYRRHSASMSADPARMLAATLRVLRRERKSVPKGYEPDFAEGWRAWCDFYGEQIVERLRATRRSERLTLWHVRAALKLVVRCRRVVGRHIRRKTALIFRSALRAARDVRG
jgi:glycosyltransferase involved in cell wall biosynthesis